MRWSVDRVDEGLAVVIAEGSDDEYTVPVAWLPEGAREGSIIKLSLDEEAREETASEIKRLQSRGATFRTLKL